MTKLLKEKIKKELICKYIPSERLRKLMERRDKLTREGRRNLYSASIKHMIYQWSEGSFSPASGVDVPESEKVKLGDHICSVTVDYPFPGGKAPSSVRGLCWCPEDIAEDYAYLLDNSPAEIYPGELIVGEFHWNLEEVRKLRYPGQIDPLGHKAVQLGAGGCSFSHTCPDLSIGLTLGFKGILGKVQKNQEKFKKAGEEEKAAYLRAAEKVCLAIIRYTKKYAQKARSLAEKETNETLKKNYLTVAKIMKNISESPPSNFHEAVQWTWLFMILDRMWCHGNGYGRIDQFLRSFYHNDKKEGCLTREEARDLIAELFVKYGGNYFALGGRDRNLKDATNELSWVCLEAYDMVGGYNCFGVLWHKDIDRDFFAYACDIVTRYGCGTPALLNHDIMIESELSSGYKKEDTWNVSYCGCQWYCVPGKEYSDHDMNCVVIIKCLKNALKIACEKKIHNFDEFWELYCEEVDKAIGALVDLKNAQYRLQPLIWPEIVTSLLMYGCIEKGRDVTDCGVSYNFTSFNVLGLANVIDSLYAIKRLVFNERKFSLPELMKALEENYEDCEELRQMLLNVPKFGNDDEYKVDEIARMVVDQLKTTGKKYRNCKGFYFRPSLFHFEGHAVAGPEIGATPDGRKKEEPLAQGANPMHGRNKKGVTATARSLARLGFGQLQGGPFQLELDPSLLQGQESPSKLIDAIATSYFEMGGVQIFFNIVSVEKLQRAMEHPEEYGDLMIRVTGYSTHFVLLDRKLQEEIIARTRHRERV